VPQVTELVISELLWLNYANPEKPVYVYIHSMGSQTPDGQARRSPLAPLAGATVQGLRLTRAPGAVCCRTSASAADGLR
jgi:ATP-dependent protease ClpP protease subunit